MGRRSVRRRTPRRGGCQRSCRAETPGTAASATRRATPGHTSVRQARRAAWPRRCYRTPDRGADDMTDRFRFVHITDTHVMAEGPWPLRSGGEFDTDASLRRVVETGAPPGPAPAVPAPGGAPPGPGRRPRAPTAGAAACDPALTRANARP